MYLCANRDKPQDAHYEPQEHTIYYSTDKVSKANLPAILAHEIAHWQKRHDHTLCSTALKVIQNEIAAWEFAVDHVIDRPSSKFIHSCLMSYVNYYGVGHKEAAKFFRWIRKRVKERWS